MKSTPALALCPPPKKLIVSVSWTRLLVRGWGVKRWRPTLATPGTSRVGPPWSFPRHGPPQLGSSELMSCFWWANCTRASFTQRDERMSVCAAAIAQSFRNCTAPRLRATSPPKGSMFSFVVSEKFARRTKLWVGVHWWSSLARSSVLRKS